MKKLTGFISIIALAIVFGFGWSAMADKPTGPPIGKHGHKASGFSAPFVVNAGAEVMTFDGSSSKGELDDDGKWLVVTGGLAALTAYQICLDANLAPVGLPFFLADKMSNVNGDLDDNGNVGTSGDYQAPALQIYTGSPGNCAGGLVQESGTTVVVD